MPPKIESDARETPHDAVPLARARWAATALFFVNGVAIASWASCVPAVQQHLGLSTGHLGLALLGMAFGAFPAMSLAAVLVTRYGSARVSQVGTLLLCLTLPLPALAFNGLSLFVALSLLGACSGALNVSENAQAAAIEGIYRRPMMASFHAFFSGGGLIGALFGAGLASLHTAPLPRLIAAACLLAMLTIRASAFLLPFQAPLAPSQSGSKPASRQSLRPLWALAFLAFSTVLNEGAVADWSAVYLRKSIGASAGVAGLGYAAFALMMVVGRASGDRVGQWLGDRAVIRNSGLLGAIGLGSALLLGGTNAALFGFACVGLGCACVYPTMMRASTRLPQVASGTAIAVISTAGYMGFFIGPPLIGFVADCVTLRWALLIVAASSAIIAVLSRSVDAEDEAHRA